MNDTSTGQISQDSNILRLTYIPWYNSEPGADGKSAKILALYGYSYIAGDFIAGWDYVSSGSYRKKPPHPEHGQIQVGIACARSTATIVIDVDNAQLFAGTHAADWVARQGREVFSARDDGSGNARIVIDARAWADNPETWPQHSTGTAGRGYDLLTAGLCAMGTHYSGASYPWPADPVASVLLADDALRIALEADGITFGAEEAPRTCDLVLTDATDEERAEGRTWMAAHSPGVIGNTVNANGNRKDLYGQALGFAWTALSYGLSREEIEPELERVLQCEARHGGNCGCWTDTELSSLFEGNGARTRPAMERAERQAEDAEKASQNGQGVTPYQPYTVAPGTLASLLQPLSARIPLSATDVALARDVLTAAESFVRLAADAGGWIISAGASWVKWGSKSEAASQGRALASAWGRHLAPEAEIRELAAINGIGAKETDERVEHQGAVRKRVTSAAGTGAISAMMDSEARGEPRWHVQLGQLDGEPWVLWAGGVPWDLRACASVLTPVPAGQYQDIHLCSAAVHPVPGATPLFDDLLAAMFPEPDVRDWAVREIAGTALWGDTSKQHPVLDGYPDTGKSTLAQLLCTILGSYAVQVSPEKLIGGRQDSASEEARATLIGKRLAWMDEPPRGDRQSTEQFKELTSGTGTISAARKFENLVSAPKRYNFLICQNPRNRLLLDAQGVKERIVFMPVSRTGPSATRNAVLALLASGTTEYPAILARLIQACSLYRGGCRLPVPLSVQMAQDAASAEGDEFAQWLLDNYVTGMPHTTALCPTLDGLRTAYNEHARQNRVPLIGRPELRERLAGLGVSVEAENTGKRRHNIVLCVPVAYRDSYSQ